MSRGVVVASWAAQVAAAVILAQTLFFKFTYAPETAAIFDGRGGRAGATAVGLLELAAVVLLLVPGRAAVGAALALALMAGAVFTHLTAVGVEVRDPATGAGDGGLLFGLALAVAACSAFVLVVRRELPVVGRVRPAAPAAATR